MFSSYNFFSEIVCKRKEFDESMAPNTRVTLMHAPYKKCFPTERFHKMSVWPCLSGSKAKKGRHVGSPNSPYGNWPVFSCNFSLLFQ